MPTKRSRYTVNIPTEHEAAVIARAKQLNRSIANYIEWLVRQDLSGETSVQEPRAPYGTPTVHGPKEKPPDNPGRTTGAGPRHRVSKSA